MRIAKPEVTRENSSGLARKRALLALAVEAEVAALAVAVLEPHRRVGLALVDELGGEHAAGAASPQVTGSPSAVSAS